MKRTLSHLLATAAFCGTLLTGTIMAQAADLPAPAYKAPPPIGPIVAPFTWSGFYLGANLGYGFGESQWTGGAGSFNASPKGVIGGLTAGYNFQTGSWVWGIEGDLDYADLNGSGSSAGCPSCTIKDTWLGTLRGRLGYSMGNWMVYGTGGGAFSQIKASSPTGSSTKTDNGWAAGAGVEYAWNGPWSVKVEYLYVDLGDVTCPAAACGLASDATVDFKANIVRAGLNYRF